MVQRVVRAEDVDGLVIRVAFSDGAEGDIDLRDDLEGVVFGPLRDPQSFRQFRLDKELHTLVWPRGAGAAPELLSEKFRVGVQGCGASTSFR